MDRSVVSQEGDIKLGQDWDLFFPFMLIYLPIVEFLCSNNIYLQIRQMTSCVPSRENYAPMPRLSELGMPCTLCRI
jgi:hypothetical protein